MAATVRSPPVPAAERYSSQRFNSTARSRLTSTSSGRGGSSSIFDDFQNGVPMLSDLARPL